MSNTNKDDKNLIENDSPDKTEKFDLYTEKIVSSPWNKIRRVLKHIAKVVGSAVLFALVVCVVMIFAYPCFKRFVPQEEETTRNHVVIPTDSQNDGETEYSFEQTTEDSSSDMFSEEPTVESEGSESQEDPVTVSEENPDETLNGNQSDYVKNDEFHERVDDIVNSALENYKPGISQYDALRDSLRAKVTEISRSMVTVSVTNEGNDAELVDFIESVGVIVAEDEEYVYIMTSSPTILEKNNIFVSFADGTAASASVVCADSVTGISILNCDKALFSRPVQIKNIVLGNSYLVQQTDPLLAVGTLYGYSGVVTEVSAISTKNTIGLLDANYRLLVTDVISSANENGFLFNVTGELVGIIIPSYEDDNVVRAYAISELKPLIERLINGKETPYVGVFIENVTSVMKNAYNMPSGVYVDSVESDSPAFLGGIQNGDIIVGVGGVTVTSAREFQSAVFAHADEPEVIFTIHRASKDGYREIDLTIQMR